ncbi:hypothetical protein CS542_05425 [Pedobacter sp. IW39]|nr:hypothetical protein CS542_05425 [Pedobacter sp. IW39]
MFIVLIVNLLVYRFRFKNAFRLEEGAFMFYYSYYTNIHLPPAFPVVVIIMDVSVELFIICP